MREKGSQRRSGAPDQAGPHWKGLPVMFVRAALAAVLLLMLVTSCQQAHPDEPPVGVVPHALGAKLVDPDHATAPEVIVGWKGVSFGTARPASESLTATITNPSAEAKNGRLVIVASGLDGRLVERHIGKFLVESNATTDVSFAAQDIPLQSEVATSFTVLQVEIDRPDGYTMRTGNQPLYYRFDDEYKTVHLYHVDDVADLPNGGIVVADPMEVRGRVLDENLQWSDVSKSDGSSGYRLGLTGVRAVAASPGDPQPDTLDSQGGPPPPAPLSASITVCSSWRVQFVDAGFGEDAYTSNAWTDVPARYARAWVLSVPGNEAYWSGTLNSSGCTPPVSLPAGTFRLQQSTTGLGYSGIYFNNYYMSGGVAFQYQVWADFTSSGSGTSTVTVHPTFNNDAIQAAAVSSQEVYWHWITLYYGGGGLGFVNGTYTVHANEGCGPPLEPPTDSCYSSVDQLVHLGTTLVLGYTDAHWKYVVGHETGHMVQDRVMGQPYYFYWNEASERLCKCNYGTEWGNTVHCLQSREASGGAQFEGFAHAFASRVFNSPFQANGVFVYYKPFEYPAYYFQYPPEGRNAFGPMRWMESFCLAPEHGVELDWLTFEYNLSSHDRTSATDFPQLFDIYKLACTGSTSTKCNDQQVQWLDLQWYAAGYYGGVQDPRFQRFQLTGQDFGVDH